MATAERDAPALKSKRKRRFSWLELILLVSSAALLIQLFGPWVSRTWHEWPRAGRQVAISPSVTTKDMQQWEMRSWIYFPEDYGNGEKFPLLLFLHGAGERGNNLKHVLRNGLPGIIAKGKQLPMMVLSPQCPPDQQWDTQQLLALLDYLQSKYSVDRNRVYVCGFSMGGFGTWQLAIEAPQRFAAIIPIAGGGDVDRADQLASLPIWAFHGDEDRTVPVEQTTRMIDAIQRAGGSPRLSVLKGEGHGIANRVLFRSDLYEWLLAHHRSSQFE
jgi:poly(3-hydroxybutyrate) depolymerase